MSSTPIRNSSETNLHLSGLSALALAADVQRRNAGGFQQMGLQDASLVLVGGRAAGKTTIGLLASTFLRRPLVDSDKLYEKLYHCSIAESAAKEGMDTFREREEQMLRKLLEVYPRNTVIVLGAGVIERESNRRILRAWGEANGPVTHVCRDPHIVLSHLSRRIGRSTYANLEEEYDQVWRRRLPLYVESTNTVFVNLDAGLPQDSQPASTLALKPLESAVRQYLCQIYGLRYPIKPLELSWNAPQSLCLVVPNSPNSFPDATILPKLCAGVQAIEFRVDHYCSAPPSTASSLNNQPRNPDWFVVGQALALLRSKSGLPILYTLRSCGQGGKYAGSEAEYIVLIEAAFRQACDFVDIEMRLSDDQLSQLMQKKGRSKVILSHTWLESDSEIPWTSQQMLEKYERGKKYEADAVKIVKPASSIADNFASLALQASLASQQDVPLIAINSGLLGRLSQQFNPILSPVTAAGLPYNSVESLLTAPELFRSLHTSGSLRSNTIFIPNQLSRTHLCDGFSAAVGTLGLPFKLTATDITMQVLAFRKDFGGGIVSAYPAQDCPFTTSPASHAIGHGDTLSFIQETQVASFAPQGDRTICLENFRHVAIGHSIEAHLSPVNAISAATTAIVEGASRPLDRDVIYSLASLGITSIILVNCSAEMIDFAASLSSSSMRMQISSAPDLDHLAQDSTHRQPSIIVFCHGVIALPTTLSEAPMGGTILLLGQEKGEERMDGWIEVGEGMVENELMCLRFKAYTGQRMPEKLTA